MRFCRRVATILTIALTALFTHARTRAANMSPEAFAAFMPDLATRTAAADTLFSPRALALSSGADIPAPGTPHPPGAAAAALGAQPRQVGASPQSGSAAVPPAQTGGDPFRVASPDSQGELLNATSDAATTSYGPQAPSPVGAVVINEILYNPLLPRAEFVELFNTSATQGFDLSGWEFNGLGYTFPAGAFIPPRGYLVLARDRAAFSTIYGSAVTVFDQYPGNLQADGETLSLLRPGGAAEPPLVVDRVRYEAAPPWPATAPGVALQLRDPARDNSRVANWAVARTNAAGPASVTLVAYESTWRYMQVSNLDGINWTAPAFNDTAWPAGPGLLAYENNSAITPLIRTALNDPRTPTNNLLSGHACYFRIPVPVKDDLTGYTVTASAYVDDGAVFYVNGSEVKRLRIAEGVVVTNRTFATGQPPGGDATAPDVFALPASLFPPGTNLIAVEVHQNQANSSDITFGLRLVANAPSAILMAATPGASNAMAVPLAEFPDLWLNELQAENLSGPADAAGERDPWIELFNAGSNALSLDGFFLSDNYTNLDTWAFPSDAVVPAGGFLIVWCDNQPHQGTAAVPHAGFRLAPAAGQVALSRRLGGTNQLVDYLTYTNLPANWAYGNIPDGQPFFRNRLFYATPGTTNSAAAQPLNIFVNEWMADNLRTLADPADGQFEDWFELYNAGTNTADLGGCYLSDHPTNAFQFRIPDNSRYTLPPGGYLLVWADNESGQNSADRADLHVNFALSKGGDAIVFSAPDGTLVDAVSFGAQVSDVSQGRFPDGAPTLMSLTLPTPRGPNRLPNSQPVIEPLPDRELTLGQTLRFQVSVTDTDLPPQTLSFRLGPGAPTGAALDPATGLFAWTPTAAPDEQYVTIVVSDDGQPPLDATATFRVVVHPRPHVSVRLTSGLLELTWPRGILQEADDITGPYHDVSDTPPYAVQPTATRKFYRIRL